MRINVALGLLAAAFGFAVAQPGNAVASPVSDAWPYSDMGLGGYNAERDLVPYLFGLGQQGTITYKDFSGDTELFSTHANYFAFPVLPLVYNFVYEHEEVFDSAVQSPPDGTIYDMVGLVNSAIPSMTISARYILDPDAGFGLALSGGGFGNNLIINDVGIQDTITFWASTYTLIDFEWPNNS